MSTRRALSSLIAATLCAALLAGATAAPARKKRQTPQGALSTALNDRRDDIQGCAISKAGAAATISIATHLTINARGELINARVTVTAPGGDEEGIRACVEAVLRAIKFPRIDAPLITIDRTWDMKLQ